MRAPGTSDKRPVEGELERTRGSADGPASSTESGVFPETWARPVLPGTLHCALCSEVVTSDDRRIPVEGEHVHQKTNPLGWTFEIGCFSVAPGVVLEGESTSRDTWFDGYSWRLANCRSCGSHLGWHYEGGVPDFFGLVLDRLVES